MTNHATRLAEATALLREAMSSGGDSEVADRIDAFLAASTPIASNPAPPETKPAECRGGETQTAKPADAGTVDGDAIDAIHAAVRARSEYESPAEAAVAAIMAGKVPGIYVSSDAFVDIAGQMARERDAAVARAEKAEEELEIRRQGPQGYGINDVRSKLMMLGRHEIMEQIDGILGQAIDRRDEQRKRAEKAEAERDAALSREDLMAGDLERSRKAVKALTVERDRLTAERREVVVKIPQRFELDGEGFQPCLNGSLIHYDSTVSAIVAAGGEIA